MTTTVVSVPTRADRAQSAPSESRVDRDSHFNGLYETKQNLRVEGIAEGEILCDGTVVVAEGARVKAKVTANTVIVAGEMEGEITCRDVFEIMPSGRVEASVSARRLVVQEGGLYNGEFHMMTNTNGPVVSGSSNLPLPAAIAAEHADQSTLSADEWWSKMSAPAAGASTGGNGKKQKSN